MQQTLLITAFLLTLCGLGGALASVAWLPLPWMLGALIVSALIAGLGRAPLALPDGYRFPERFRNGFIALIGVMIGTQVTPQVLDLARTLPWSMTALVLYVGLVFAGNYWLFRRYGGYDPATAFFSAAPGGLIDSITLGEAAGADIQRLAAQQFLRVIVVIVSLPLAISFWVGEPVGSAAGMDGVVSAAPVGPATLGLIALTAAAGFALGSRLRLPASHLIGPLILCAAVTLLFGLDLHLPFWLVALAQVVVGASLGLRFRNISAALLRLAVSLSLVTVCFMMALGAVFAYALEPLTGIRFDHMLISFAPGGVTEMSLVALSLAATPALVTLHHLVRILLTVFLMALMARRLGFSPRQPRPSRRA